MKVFLFLLASLIAAPSLAQDKPKTGTVTGKILDRKTKEVLIGAFVSVINHPKFYTRTTISGEYILLNIPVGRYEFKVSYVGYQNEKVEFEIFDDSVLVKNVGLIEDIPRGCEISNERPLIDRAQTTSIHYYNAERIQNLPLR